VILECTVKFTLTYANGGDFHLGGSQSIGVLDVLREPHEAFDISHIAKYRRDYLN
jgi:hypothetical protein